MKLLVESLTVPKNQITFDLTKFEFLANVCGYAGGPQNVHHFTESFVKRLFFFNRYPNPLEVFDGTHVRFWDWDRELGQNTRNYLIDVCTLLNNILADNASEITPKQASSYHQALKDILVKYNLISQENLDQRQKLLKDKDKDRKTSSTRKAKAEFEQELMILGPTVIEGGIVYPGGRDYIKAFENFDDFPWADYCYSVFDQEHLEDLKNLASKLGIKFGAKANKADVCVTLSDYYDQKLKADAANIPFTFVQDVIVAPSSISSTKISKASKVAPTSGRATPPKLPIPSVRPSGPSLRKPVVIPAVQTFETASSASSSSSIPLPPTMPDAPKTRKSIAHLPIIAPRPKRK